jgi:hypothetical protein
MDIHPQYTFDNSGNPLGVFLPIEEWNELTKELQLEIPQWQKDKVLKEKMKIEADPSLLTNWNIVKEKYQAK